ncbi:MAG TPA: hypothetical protein VGB59_01490 [Allosphingosinicella sp.]|jgi:hypothetical protein
MRIRGGTVAALLLLGGCASTAEKAPAPKAAPRLPQPTPYTTSGLESVIGRNAAALQVQFGKPALDIREGTARKLQFAGPACVLDAYLYPPKAGGDPIVTHVDARLPDGRDMDRASCAAALTLRR